VDIVVKHAPLTAKQMPQRTLLLDSAERYELLKYIEDIVKDCMNHWIDPSI